MYVHLRCLRCKRELMVTDEIMRRLGTTQYSYCEDCLYKAVKLLIIQDETVRQPEPDNINHPVKTRKEDFFERFPNAPKDDSGMPIPCVRLLGYIQKQCYADCYADRERECAVCWDKDLEE